MVHFIMCLVRIKEMVSGDLELHRKDCHSDVY